MNEPLVSIVMPIFNGARHLEGAIASCLTQSHHRLELILVDDHSTDATPEIIHQAAARDDRVRTVRHDRNRKLPAALNTGFTQASGTYLTWTSDDNLYHQDAIRDLASVLKHVPYVAVVYADYTVIDEAGSALHEVSVGTPEQLVLGNVVAGCFLYRRSVAEAIGSYDEDLFLAEDYDFWLRASQCVRFGVLRKNLYQYREHQLSLSASRGASISQAYARALLKSEAYLDLAQEKLKGRAYFKLGIRLFESGEQARGAEYVARAARDYRTLDQWPDFVASQLIYLHGGELRAEADLRRLLDALSDAGFGSDEFRRKLLARYHVVASFRAARQRDAGGVRSHFLRGLTLDPACLRNRGLLKAFLQACLGRTLERSGRTTT